MSTEINKGIVNRLFDEVFNQGKIQIIDELVAENVVSHEPAELELGLIPKKGIDNFREVAKAFLTAFPDAEIPLYDSIAEGDRVAARWGLHGTHQGTFMGVPRTGKRVNVDGIIVYRLEHQKIVEYWGIFDTYALMRQLDAL